MAKADEPVSEEFPLLGFERKHNVQALSAFVDELVHPGDGLPTRRSEVGPEHRNQAPLDLFVIRTNIIDRNRAPVLEIEGPVDHESKPQASPIELEKTENLVRVEKIPTGSAGQERGQLASSQFVDVEHLNWRGPERSHLTALGSQRRPEGECVA